MFSSHSRYKRSNRTIAIALLRLSRSSIERAAIRATMRRVTEGSSSRRASPSVVATHFHRELREIVARFPSHPFTGVFVWTTTFSVSPVRFRPVGNPAPMISLFSRGPGRPGGARGAPGGIDQKYISPRYDSAECFPLLGVEEG